MNYLPLILRSTLYGFVSIFCLVAPAVSLAKASAVNEEQDGLLVIQVEETSSPLGLWELHQDPLENAHTGDGYLTFTGNSPVSGPAVSPLEYTFTIHKAGLYYLHLRCAKEVLTIKGKKRTDVSNDCYVRVEGNYGAGPNAGDAHRKDAPLSLLRSDTKFFGGAANAFEWATGNRLDPGGHNNKRVAVYDFKAGESYQLVMSGRSQHFKVDCLAFRHADVSPKVVNQIDQSSKTALAADPRPFRKETDLLIAQFDNYPDSDDVHSQAAVGSFLSHVAFEGMNTLAVAGAYGRQPGNAKWKYINSNELFELAFGAENVRWVDAHADRAFAANFIKNQAKPVLEAGGKVWVMEAGQSDITADWLAALIADGVANTATNVIVVQHSIWNIKQTTPTALDYVKQHAHFVKIEDGNHGGNGTPDYQESSTEYLAAIFDASNPNTFAQSLWLKAKEITDACGYKGGPIPGGGIDFSDTAEAMWIFALDAQLPTVQAFLDAFVVNTPPQ